MIRIIIDWKTVSPFLKLISGVLTIEDVDIRYQHFKTLLKCRVKREPGCIGFSSENNDDYFIPSEIMNKYDEHIKHLIDAYYNGVLLDNSIVSWIDEDKAV